MPIAEIFLSASIKFLLDKLTSGELLKFARREGIHSEIKKWEGMLLKIEAVLSDAEQQQTESRSVRLWLDDLQDLAYDLDDILDEFATEEIKRRLDGLNPLQPSTSTSTSTSTAPAPARDGNKKEVIEFLLRDENKIGVIPIVGMGGLGKTTLAQAVYNDENVKTHFDLKAWVYVSEEFDVMRITKAILESVTSCPCDFENLDIVQDQLKRSLAGKKFLIVLDDYWNKNYNDWNVLKSPFCDGTLGSKVVVTTRDKNVAVMMETVKHYVLQPLSFEDCWLVFSQHAFGCRSMDENPNLVDIGRQIVEKCKGFPLAARTLGGLLRCEEREDEWANVLNSKIWREDNEILPSLRLSYHHLPSYLKPCFAYCAILPKDYEFSEKELVLLWMAEGFVHQERGKKRMEDIASEYFHELLSRSFFQLSITIGNSKLFVMHDLINDLAQEISGEICFRLEEKLKDRDKYRDLHRARHSSYMQHIPTEVKIFDIFDDAKHMRTFLPFSLSHPWSKSFIHEGPNYLKDDSVGPFSYFGNNISFSLFPKLRCARAFSLRGYSIIELPNSIGDMTHLRYLDLSFTGIERLPEWTQNLYNLQTLMLRECKQLKNLPNDMKNLINLRYLDVTNSNRLREIPRGIGRMESLQQLSNFFVTKDNGYRLRELGNLKHIRGSICLSGLQHVMDSLDARGASLIEKEQLDVLLMVWGELFEKWRILCEETLDDISNGFASEVLHMLQPHKNLKELHIYNYCGVRFASWLGEPQYSNMVRKKLEDCKNCTSLPPLGQLCSLKELYIRGMSAIKHVGDEFYGQPRDRCEPFSKLEILCFEYMPEWQDWFAFGVVEELQPFASVSKLSIRYCPKLLGKLPSNLPSLKELQIFRCQELLVEVPSLFFPSLTSLTVDGIKLPPSLSMHSEMRNTIEPNFLSSLCIRNILMLDSSYNISICNEEEISVNSPFRHLGSVTHLTVHEIQKLRYLPKWLSRELTGLEQLDISDCEELRTLSLKNNHEVKKLHHHFPALRKLSIRDCPQLVSLYEEEEEEEENDEESEGQQEHEGIRCFMLRLETLRIMFCRKLEKLPRGLNTLMSLVHLTIEYCPKLVTFPETCFPSTLRTLRISHCDALESPLLLWNSLESLCVIDCPSLTCLTLSSVCSSSRGRGGLPLSLQFLHIWNCGKLESLVVGEEEEIKINCPSLETVEILRCASLKYLPYTLNNKSLEKLRNMRIESCENLQYLLGGWFHAITKLRSISIHGCRKLRTLTSLTGRLIGEGIRGERVVSCILKDKGFFTNLTSLDLRGITVGMHPSEWGLHRLSSLEYFHIQGPIRVAREDDDGGGEVVEVSVFPLDGMFLPSSLICLKIIDFPDLKRLSSKGFECLSSLKTLELRGSPRFAYLPENGGLPSSRLHIVGSPRLAKRCEREKGHYWPFISHIPTLILA